MKYFIQLAYKGTNYRGWQRQPNAISVQAILEDAVERIMGKKINCIPCGRTDAGVHASEFFCHIILENKPDFDPVFRLNKILPDDISIQDFREVRRDVHAQHGAVSRTYEYFIHHKKNPFLSELSALYSNENLAFESMEKAVDMISKSKDFRAFCKQPDLYKSTICDISSTKIRQFDDGNRIHFLISANRFLRGMVRILVANILEVGYGRLSLEDFGNCLKNGTRPPYFNEAHPQGLYLTKVEYESGIYL